MKMTRISVCAVALFTVLAAHAKSPPAPPGPTLAESVAKAELIVVGKLEPWETHQSLPAKPGAKGPWAFRYATVNIQIREVLKGKAGQKTVPIRFCVGWVDKPESDSVPGEYQTRADGVWILSRDQGHLVGPCFPVEQQAEIVGLIKQLPVAVEPVREKPVVVPIQRLPDSPAPPMVKITREDAEAKALDAAQALLKDKPSHLRALRQDGPATLAGVPRQPTWYVGYMADNGRTGIGIRVTVDAVTGEAQAVVAQGGR